MPNDNTFQLEQTALAWAKITLEQFERKSRALGIPEGELIKSFKTHVNLHSGGNILKIDLMYAFWGKFVDMGVGRGVKFGEVDGSNRKSKPWFSKTFFKEYVKLRHILDEQLSERISQIVVDRLGESKK